MAAEAGAYRYAGGGGGSGYVWTSSTASNKPSGYSVATKYYLTNAGTYGSGEPGFVSNPNTDGNGYARITIVSATVVTGTYEVIVVDASWIDIEEQIANGTLTGEFNYNGYTIVANPSTIRNSLVNIDEVTVSNVKGTTATITVTATDMDEDVLTYTLEIDGKTYTSTTGIFNVTGLAESTTYSFTVKVSDGIRDAVTQTGTVKTTAIPVITSVTPSNVTGASVTITVKATDSDGDTLTYTLVINGKIYTSTTGIFNVTGLSESTTYPYTVKVSDGINTEVTKTGSVTTVENTAPTITHNYDYTSSKTTSSFTIRMRATDVDGDSLTYTLYYSTSENGTYTKGKTATASASSYTTIAATELSEYTPYWWYITVTDGQETVTSGKQTLNTNCSGTGSTCTLATYCDDASYNHTNCCNNTLYTVCGGAISYRDGWYLNPGQPCVYCGTSIADGGLTAEYQRHTCADGRGTYWVCQACLSSDTSRYDVCGFKIECTEGVKSSTCPTHSYASQGHYWCSSHVINCGSSNSHSCCEHGYTYEHD